MAADKKLGWLNEATAVFPPRTQCVGGRASDAVGNRERDFVGDFARLIDRIDAARDDTNVEVGEFLLMFFKAS
jgi:hypothetical protein